MRLFKRKGEAEAPPKALTDDELYEVLQQPIWATSNVPLDKEVTLEYLLRLSDDQKQSRSWFTLILNERGRVGIKLKPVEFLCYLSTKRIMKKIKERGDRFHENATMILKELAFADGEDIKNMLRLFPGNKDFILDAFIVEGQEERKKLFLEIMALWYDVNQYQNRNH